MMFPNMHRKRPVLKSLFNKVSGLQPAALSKKQTPTQMFSREIIKNTFFYGTPPDDCFRKSTRFYGTGCNA